MTFQPYANVCVCVCELRVAMIISGNGKILFESQLHFNSSLMS